MQTLLNGLTFIVPFVICAIHVMYFGQIRRYWVFVFSVAVVFLLAVLTAYLVNALNIILAFVFAIIYSVMACGVSWLGLRFFSSKK